MNRIALAFACLLIGFSASAKTYDFVPQPLSVEESSDKAVAPAKVRIDSRKFGELVDTYVATAPVDVKAGRCCSYVKLAIDEKIEGNDAYRLKVGRRHIRISASTQDGLWFGLQTLTQLLLQGVDHRCTIEDSPRFAYRGAMLDCCRHFFTVGEVEKFIDMMAVHKLNVFHWHLTDDQGWRIEIKKYPLLTSVGSVRAGSYNTNYSGDQDNDLYVAGPYGGFYTQDDIREVVKYAADRHITIIPEIEIPGHSVAALTSYPWLGCTGGPYEVRQEWGISDDVMCLGKKSTWDFCRDVLDEVCELFPGPYVHIGGDEAPRTRWHECPDCQALMEKEGFDREAELQSWITDKVEEYLAGKGKRIIGWDEVLEGGVSKTAVVMSWRGSTGGQQAAAMGNDVIMVDKYYCYFDCYQTESREGELRAHHRSIPLSKVWSYNPVADMDEAAAAHVLGVQCNTWTEHISDFDRVYFMNLPRMGALAEVAWTDQGRRGTYDEFMGRLTGVMIPEYEAAGWTVSPYYKADLK